MDALKSDFCQVGDPVTRVWKCRIPRPMDVSHVCVTTNDADDGKRCAAMSLYLFGPANITVFLKMRYFAM